MFGDLVQHVIVKTNACIDGNRSLAVKVYRYGNGCLTGFTYLGCHTLCRRLFTVLAAHKGQHARHVIRAANRDTNASGKPRLV